MAPYPELRCPGASHPAAGPSRSHGKEGADGLICFPLLTAANPLGRHPSPWRPQPPSDAPPLKVSASPASQTPAPPPLHQDLPPWVILENPRERPPGGTGPVPWRARPRVGQSMASSPGPDWRPGCCRTPPDPVSGGADDSNANGRNSGDQGPVHRQFPETCPPPIPVASP